MSSSLSDVRLNTGGRACAQIVQCAAAMASIDVAAAGKRQATKRSGGTAGAAATVCRVG